MRPTVRQLRGMRLTAFLVDLGLGAGVALVGGALATLLVGSLSWPNAPTLIRAVWGVAWAGLLGFLLLRDSLPAGSPGRRLVGLRVVRRTRTRSPNLLQSVLRNLPLLVPPLALWELARLGRVERRFGDLIAGTQVEEA